MYGYIYKTTNLVNGKIYIGKHKAQQFEPEVYIGSGLLLREAINKYGIDSFVQELVEICDTRESLDEREKYWIKYYDATNNNIGYNLTFGGDGGDTLSLLNKNKLQERGSKISNKLKHHSVSESTKQKLSERAKHNWSDAEYREKMRVANDERLRNNPDINNKISSSHKKRILEMTDEERLAYSKAQSDLMKRLWSNEEYRNRQCDAHTSEEYNELMKNNYGKNKNRVYIHKIIDGSVFRKMVIKDDLDIYLQDGWELGKSSFDISDETRKKQSEARKRLNVDNGIKIRCVESNIVYFGFKDAHEKTGVSLYMIRKSVKDHIKVNGLTFEIVNTPVGGDDL